MNERCAVMDWLHIQGITQAQCSQGQAPYYNDQDKVLTESEWESESVAFFVFSRFYYTLVLCKWPRSLSVRRLKLRFEWTEQAFYGNRKALSYRSMFIMYNIVPVVFMCDLHLFVLQKAPNNAGLRAKTQPLICSTFLQLQDSQHQIIKVYRDPTQPHSSYCSVWCAHMGIVTFSFFFSFSLSFSLLSIHHPSVLPSFICLPSFFSFSFSPFFCSLLLFLLPSFPLVRMGRS